MKRENIRIDDMPINQKAVYISLAISHIWGFMLMWPAMNGTANSVTEGMFSSVGFMIFSNLGVLVGGKSWEKFAAMRYGKKDVKYESSSTVSIPAEESAEDRGRGSQTSGD